MNRNTLAGLIIILIVLGVVSSIIILLVMSGLEDFRLQLGEPVPNGGDLDISFVDIYFEEGISDSKIGSCYLVVNVTNENDFDLAWVGIEINYTDTKYGDENSAWKAIHNLKSNETKSEMWWLTPMCVYEDIEISRFKDFRIIEIDAYQYRNET